MAKDNTHISRWFSQVSAWLLLAMVLATVVPFNVLHSHDNPETVVSVEVETTSENHHACDHQVHLAKEHKFCFLCHFCFTPLAPDSSLYLSEKNVTATPNTYTHYSNRYTYTLTGQVLNKGSPLT